MLSEIVPEEFAAALDDVVAEVLAAADWQCRRSIACRLPAAWAWRLHSTAAWRGVAGSCDWGIRGLAAGRSRSCCVPSRGLSASNGP